jgi:1,4-dihydroxy-2-naphthoyl-CoA hydrolase
MSIWFKQDIQLSDFNNLGKNTLGEHLGMEFTEIDSIF